jgi:hypothetical protein
MTIVSRQWGRLLASLLALLFAYVFVSRALDTGSYWQYLGGTLFLYLSVRLFLQFMRLVKPLK